MPPTPTVEIPPPADTLVPTLPEAEVTGVVVLVSAAEPDPSLKQAVEAAASARGLVFVQLNEISAETAPTNLVMVVSNADFPALAQMADQMPDVNFVINGQSAVGSKPNLTVLGGASDQRLAQAFLAGYIAAVQSEEYRIGIISVNDAAGQNFRRAFLNGVIYFCGTCAPIYPPFVVYPQYQELAPGSDREVLENAARAMIAEGVNMMLIAPEHQEPDFYTFLAQNGVRLLGTDAPQGGMEGNWVASVLLRTGTDLGSVLESVLDGAPVPESGEVVEIDFTGVGEARLAHFNEILERLYSGEIDPLGSVD